MILTLYVYTAEQLNLPTLWGQKTCGYEIFIPGLVIFGYGFRLNWFDKYLVGVTLTNKEIPTEDDIEEELETNTPEQLKLPFDDL